MEETIETKIRREKKWKIPISRIESMVQMKKRGHVEPGLNKLITVEWHDDILEKKNEEERDDREVNI